MSYPTAPESVGDHPVRRTRIGYLAMLACGQHSIDEKTRRCEKCLADEPSIIAARTYKTEQERLALARAKAAA